MPVTVLPSMVALTAPVVFTKSPDAAAPGIVKETLMVQDAWDARVPPEKLIEVVPMPPTEPPQSLLTKLE